MDDNHEKLEYDFEQARQKLFRVLGWLDGGRAAEARYSQTYQRLAKAGLRPQIKKKYRKQ